MENANRHGVLDTKTIPAMPGQAENALLGIILPVWKPGN